MDEPTDLPEIDLGASEAQQVDELQAWIERERERQGIKPDGSGVCNWPSHRTPMKG